MCSLVNRIERCSAIQRKPNHRSQFYYSEEAHPETKMIAKKLKDVSPVYSSRLGKQVVLLVTIRQCHVPMPCSIIGESLADVRVRVQPG
jgi:hypothetical protein